MCGLAEPEVDLLQEEVSHQTRHHRELVLERVRRRGEDRLRVRVFLRVLCREVRMRPVVVAAQCVAEVAEGHGHPLDVRAILVGCRVEGLDEDLDVPGLFGQVR